MYGHLRFADDSGVAATARSRTLDLTMASGGILPLRHMTRSLFFYFGGGGFGGVGYMAEGRSWVGLCLGGTGIGLFGCGCGWEGVRVDR